MPQPHNTLKVVWGGPVSGQDRWSIGLNFQCTPVVAAISPAEMNAVAASMATAFTANYWKTGAGLGLLGNPAAVKFDTVRSYHYDGSGTLDAQGAATVAAVPGTGAVAAPCYVAKVCTLLTASFGRSFRGRIYLPNVTPNLDTTNLQFTDTATTAAGVKAFIVACNALVPTLGGATAVILCCVSSRTLGANNLVTGIKIDSIPDTQRGRINKDTATVSSSLTIP